MNHNPTYPTSTTNSATASRAMFQQLHTEGDLLFLGNAWDTASALALEKAGFPAIGTTSYGIAQASGKRDGEEISFAQLLSIVHDLVACVKIPVSVDIEAGYASLHSDIVDHALHIADAGAAGLNIEDSPKDRNELRGATEQAKLLSQIRHALDARGFGDFFINARTDVYLQSSDSAAPASLLAAALTRSKAYAESGANGIFIPGLSYTKDISTLVSAIPLPLNIMSLPGLTDIAHLQKIGVRRFSFGNALSDQVLALLEQSATQLWQQQTTASLYHQKDS